MTLFGHLHLRFIVNNLILGHCSASDVLRELLSHRFASVSLSPLSFSHIASGEFLEFETFRWLMANFHIGLSFWALMVAWSFGVFLVTAMTIRKVLPVVAGSVIYAFLHMFLFSIVTGIMFAVELSPRTLRINPLTFLHDLTPWPQ